MITTTALAIAAPDAINFIGDFMKERAISGLQIVVLLALWSMIIIKIIFFNEVL